MVSSGMSLVKYGLFFFNLIFVIISIVIISCGGVLLSDINNNKIHDVVEGAPKGSAIVLILVGVSIFAVAFLGCCGAVKESYCMLLTFSTVIFLLFITELVAGGIIYAFRNDLKSEAVKGMHKAINNYQEANTTYAPVDDLQKNLKCCGAENATDWEKTDFFRTNKHYPNSCCSPDKLTGNATCTDDLPFDVPCYEAIRDTLKGVTYSLATSAIVVAVAQFLGMLFACCLARNIKREYDVV